MYSLEDTWDLNHTFRASETNLMTLRSLTDDAPNMLRTSFRSFAFYRELDEPFFRELFFAAKYPPPMTWGGQKTWHRQKSVHLF